MRCRDQCRAFRSIPSSATVGVVSCYQTQAEKGHFSFSLKAEMEASERSIHSGNRELLNMCAFIFPVSKESGGVTPQHNDFQPVINGLFSL